MLSISDFNWAFPLGSKVQTVKGEVIQMLGYSVLRAEGNYGTRPGLVQSNFKYILLPTGWGCSSMYKPQWLNPTICFCNNLSTTDQFSPLLLKPHSLAVSWILLLCWSRFLFPTIQRWWQHSVSWPWVFCHNCFPMWHWNGFWTWQLIFFGKNSYPPKIAQIRPSWCLKHYILKRIKSFYTCVS